MEERYQGRRAKRMIADYCSCIKRNLNNIEYGLGTFNRVIFKDFASDCYSKNIISQ